MKYMRKPETVDAFRFDEMSERNAPEWFGREVESGNISIDRAVMDGAVKVYGCTIQTPQTHGRIKAKNGDYIVREANGYMRPYKPKEFRKMFERNEQE